MMSAARSAGMMRYKKRAAQQQSKQQQQQHQQQKANAIFWNLRKEQVRALRMTWARLCEPPRSNCKGIVNLVERVWEKLDTKDPTVRNIFYNAAFVETMHDRCERRRSKGSIATLRDHTHFFVSLISQ
ncbi:hypothetical protein GCK32_013429, partial [Trichostrongylus colubriformis]